MAKPPASPPSSDISGIDEDRKAIDHPDNVDGQDQVRIEKGNTEAKGRPRSGTGSEAIGD